MPSRIYCIDKDNIIYLNNNPISDVYSLAT
nr:MAG TPA: hypothetical protein [Bacteriophage sp.]